MTDVDLGVCDGQLFSGDGNGTAVLLPGGRYVPSAPLLWFTRELLQAEGWTVLTALQTKVGWEKHFANDMVFTNHATPVKKVTGRDAFLETTRGFYGIIDTVQVNDLLVDGDRACALTHYRLQPPSGEAFTSDVAEVFTVTDHRINSFSIYFDTAPFPS